MKNRMIINHDLLVKLKAIEVYEDEGIKKTVLELIADSGSYKVTLPDSI